MRKTFNGDEEVPLAPHGAPPLPIDPGDVRLPCLSCSDLTKRKVLAQLGARCQRCYDAYCRAPQPTPARSIYARREQERTKPVPGNVTELAELPMPAAIPLPNASQEAAEAVNAEIQAMQP